MRCTRCDQPAVPQSVGRTPRGLLIFGWCSSCMDDHGCARIEAPPFGPRLLETEAKPARVGPVWPEWARGPAASDPEQTRNGLSGIRLVASLLAIWGVVFCGMGIIRLPFAANRGAGAVSNWLSNGATTFLVGGGLALFALAGLLWDVTIPVQRRRSQPSESVALDLPSPPSIPPQSSLARPYRKLI